MSNNVEKSSWYFINIFIGLNLLLLCSASADPALKKYFTANAAYNRKLYSVATTQFENFLKAHSSHPKADLALRGLGLSHYALKQYNEAIPCFSKLISKNNLDKTINRERIIILQGQCLLQSSQKSKAKDLFTNEVQSLSNPIYKNSALAFIIDISFGNSNWDDVVKWTSIIKNSKPSPDQLTRAIYQMGFAYYQKDQITEAIKALNSSSDNIISDKWKTRISYLLGECHSKNEQLEEAEKSFSIALEGMAKEESKECHFRLGVTRFLMAKYEQALANFDIFLQENKDLQDPKSRQATLYKGRIYYELKKYLEAETELQKLTQANDDLSAQANLWLARVFSNGKNDHEKSAEILSSSLTKFKQSNLISNIEFEYANALMAKSPADWKNALSSLSNIEKRGGFPQLSEVQAQKIVCLHNLKNYQLSLSLSEQFLVQFPKHNLKDNTLFIRAENLLQLKRNNEALRAFNNFLKENNKHNKTDRAKLRKAQLHHIAKDWDNALTAAEPLLNLSKFNNQFSQVPFILGDSHFMKKNWPNAISFLKIFISEFQNNKTVSDTELIKSTPNLDRAILQLGIAYDRSNNKNEALKNLSMLLENSPQESEQLPLALVETGRIAFQQNNLVLARKALQQYVENQSLTSFKKNLATQMPQVMYYMGWVNNEENKFKEAYDCFSKVPANHPLAADAALQKGVTLISLENFREASSHFSTMANTYKNHEKAEMISYYAGLSASKQKEWIQASKHYAQFTSKYPQSEFVPQALYEWAWAQKSLKKTKQAISLYEKIINNHSDSPLTLKVQTELAELNLMGGQKEKVINELTAALKTTTNKAEREIIIVQLANAYYISGDFEKSALTFETLIKEHPTSESIGTALFKAGESRLKLKETVIAREHFEKASKITNLNIGLEETIQLRLAETQASTAMHQEAVKTYRNFLETYKDSKWTSNAQFGLGLALENSGNQQEAIKEYNKLIKTKNSNDDWAVRSHFQIGECHFNMQNYELAIISFNKVEKEFTKHPAWQSKSVLEIGRILIAQGKRNEAIKRFQDVLNIYGKEKAALVARQYIQEIRSN